LLLSLKSQSGASFKPTNLQDYGFYANWEPSSSANLCLSDNDDNRSKVKQFKSFMGTDESILICTHATLRFAFEELDDAVFNDTLLAIDEFHHISADTSNHFYLQEPQTYPSHTHKVSLSNFSILGLKKTIAKRFGLVKRFIHKLTYLLIRIDFILALQ
jgi:hypothetical protein